MDKNNLVNGKYYPLWQQFVDKKDKWIGGTLTDYGDSMDRSMGISSPKGNNTIITDIKLLPNGTESAWFEITGDKFSCGFDVGHGGISGDQKDSNKGNITFAGYGGHTFIIKKLGSNDR